MNSHHNYTEQSFTIIILTAVAKLIATWKAFSEAFRKMISTEENGKIKHHLTKKTEYHGGKLFQKSC